MRLDPPTRVVSWPCSNGGVRIHSSTRVDDGECQEITALIAAATDADGVPPINEQGLLNLAASTGELGAGLEGTVQPGGAGEPEGLAEQRQVRHLVARSTSTTSPATHETGSEHAADLVLGYAQVDGDAAELVVHPAYRRRGVGTVLLHALAGSPGSTVSGSTGSPSTGHPPPSGVWAHGYLCAAQAFAAKHRLQVTRELWQMTLPVTDDALEDARRPDVARTDAASDVASLAVTAQLPDGFTVHPFTEADIDDVVALNARAFVDHPEQGRMSAADVRERMDLPWFDANGFLLVRDTTAAADGGQTDDGQTADGVQADDDQYRPLAAFHWTKQDEPANRDGPATGEVYVVAVDPAYQGRGLGGPVTALGISYLVAQGAQQITLYVDGDNTAAVATYRRAGFQRTTRDVMLSLPTPRER